MIQSFLVLFIVQTMSPRKGGMVVLIVVPLFYYICSGVSSSVCHELVCAL